MDTIVLCLFHCMFTRLDYSNALVIIRLPQTISVAMVINYAIMLTRLNGVDGCFRDMLRMDVTYCE